MMGGRVDNMYDHFHSVGLIWDEPVGDSEQQYPVKKQTRDVMTFPKLRNVKTNRYLILRIRGDVSDINWDTFE